MQRLGLFVGEQNNWTFFREIAADLGEHYRTEALVLKPPSLPFFRGRLNRMAFDRGIRSLMGRCDAAFFEWASELLVPGSHMPKTCAVVTRLHSFELYAWAPRVHWPNVDKVILVSEAMRQKFAELYPAHAHKATVVYNGCSLRRFNHPADRPSRGNLGMLCTLYPRKRVYEVVLTLHELLQEGLDVHLHVAGGVVHGPDLDEYAVALQRLTDKLGLRSRITFYDHLADPAEWLSNIDIFISHSYWEGHQVALIEAMAAGCYCLAHFWDGADEVLPEDQLYATDSDLRRRVRAYLSMDPAARLKRRQEMRDVATRRFDIEQTKIAIRKTIADALEGRN